MEPFTAEHAKNAEEKRPEKSLPLMNADHTDYTDRRGLPRINANEREWARIGKATECHDGGAERGGTEKLEDGANSGREWTLSLTGHGTHVTRVLCGLEAILTVCKREK